MLRINMPSPEPTPSKLLRVRLKRPYESPEQRAEKSAGVHARVVVAQASQRARALPILESFIHTTARPSERSCRRPAVIACW
jgi:hypothetical protein